MINYNIIMPPIQSKMITTEEKDPIKKQKKTLMKIVSLNKTHEELRSKQYHLFELLKAMNIKKQHSFSGSLCGFYTFLNPFYSEYRVRSQDIINDDYLNVSFLQKVSNKSYSQIEDTCNMLEEYTLLEMKQILDYITSKRVEMNEIKKREDKSKNFDLKLLSNLNDDVMNIIYEYLPQETKAVVYLHSIKEIDLYRKIRLMFDDNYTGAGTSKDMGILLEKIEFKIIYYNSCLINDLVENDVKELQFDAEQERINTMGRIRSNYVMQIGRKYFVPTLHQISRVKKYKSKQMRNRKMMMHIQNLSIKFLEQYDENSIIRNNLFNYGMEIVDFIYKFYKTNDDSLGIMLLNNWQKTNNTMEVINGKYSLDDDRQILHLANNNRSVGFISGYMARKSANIKTRMEKLLKNGIPKYKTKAATTKASSKSTIKTKS